VLRAVDARVTASRERVEVRGALPLGTEPGVAAPLAAVAGGASVEAG